MAGDNINLLPATGLVLINAKTLADAAGVGPLPVSVCGKSVESTFYVAFDADATAGQVVIESAPFRNYSGTWVVEGTVDFALAGKAHRVSLTLLSGALRARISSAITDGTVTVTAFTATNS